MTLVAVLGNAQASTQDPLSGLATSLTAGRDACALQAKDASTAAATANFKASLDLQGAQAQAEMDARVYGIGHGRRETRNFLIDRLQQATQASIAESAQIADKLAADSEAVKSCVATAEAKGKAEYSAFKANKRHGKQLPEAEALMTAWLTNVGEIDVGHPQGGDASLAAWNTAKVHVEIAGL